MSLETPKRPVIAFTGDGGLMMGAGELSTAAHHAARLFIIVFKDAKLQYLLQSHIWRISKRHAASQPLFDTVAIGQRDNAARSASGHLANVGDFLKVRLAPEVAVRHHPYQLRRGLDLTQLDRRPANTAQTTLA
jgi:hypothetical protein